MECTPSGRMTSMRILRSAITGSPSSSPESNVSQLSHSKEWPIRTNVLRYVGQVLLLLGQRSWEVKRQKLAVASDVLRCDAIP